MVLFGVVTSISKLISIYNRNVLYTGLMIEMSVSNTGCKCNNTNRNCPSFVPQN